MSNLENEQEYTHLEDAIEFAMNQKIKALYTSLPGIIQSFDADTRRATVLVGVQRVFTDGRKQSYPILQNVPVIFPAGGGFTITLPLAQGDTVMLLFSQRDMTNFKITLAESVPNMNVMQLSDAVAIAGFGELSITPASESGATLQSNDGENAIILEDEKIELKLGSATLTLTSASLVCTVPIEAPGYSGINGVASLMTSGINMDDQSIVGASDVTTQSGVSLKTHVHGGVTSGGDDTGGPV